MFSELKKQQCWTLNNQTTPGRALLLACFILTFYLLKIGYTPKHEMWQQRAASGQTPHQHL
jgi:hypothetical protein